MNRVRLIANTFLTVVGAIGGAGSAIGLLSVVAGGAGPNQVVGIVINALVVGVGFVCALAILIAAIAVGGFIGDAVRATKRWVQGSKAGNPFKFGRSRTTTARSALRGCRLIDRLVSYLLYSALLRLPEGLRERYAEEWADHRNQSEGLRAVWWALCLRATAFRIGYEYRHARIPRSGT